MNTQSTMETIKGTSSQVVEKIKELVHEGNVRRIIIRQEGTIVAEFPLTFGVIGAVFAPVLAAISTLVALLTECTIEIERIQEKPTVNNVFLPKVEAEMPTDVPILEEMTAMV